MSVYQGTRFEYEIFTRNGGRMAAFVTLKGGADVAYIHPDGRVQWTRYEDIFAQDQEALDEVEEMCAEIFLQNRLAYQTA